MSQRKRIVLVAAVLVAAFAMVPAPSQAVGFREGFSVRDAWEQARIWVARRIGWGELWRKEGGMINPDGSPKPGNIAPPSNTETTEEGSAINPDGVR